MGNKGRDFPSDFPPDTAAVLWAELKCGKQDLSYLRNCSLRLEAEQSVAKLKQGLVRRVCHRVPQLLEILQPKGESQPRTTASMPSGSDWSQEPRSGHDGLLVALSPHMLRCSGALTEAVEFHRRPILLSLQVVPGAPWFVAGALTTALHFDTSLGRRLERCRPERRSAVLAGWYGPSAAVFPIRPDTLECADESLERLFSPTVSYWYGNVKRAHPSDEYPVLAVDDACPKPAIMADPGLTWGRTVWTDDLELAKLLTACEHPAVRLPGVHGEHSPVRDPAPRASDAHTAFLNAFRYHSFFLDVTGPAGHPELWDFTESIFGSIFGMESCFCSRCGNHAAISVRLVSPATPQTLCWTIEPAEMSFRIADGWGDYLGRPRYLSSRRAFVAWAFSRF